MAVKKGKVRITIAPLEKGLREFAVVYGKLKRGEPMEPSYTRSFADVDTFRKSLTNNRLEMLRLIHQKKPKSVYELAKLLGRDLKSVNVDLKILREMRFLDLEKMRDKRKRVVPKVAFDHLQVDIVLT